MLIRPDALFEDAADAFLSARTLAAPAERRAFYVKPNTLTAYRRQIASLQLFFTGMRLQEIHWWNMKNYQEARVAGAEPFLRFRRPQDARPQKLPCGTVLPPRGRISCPAKPQQVNQETNFLKRLKILAGCWSEEDERFFRNLQRQEEEVPRALTPEEQLQWLETARAVPGAEIVYWYSLLAFDTCCSPNELRMLRFGHIKTGYRMIQVPWPAAKNPFRHREVVIASAEAMEALAWLIRRAQELGSGDFATHPSAHLFPFGQRRRGTSTVYDFARPMSSSGLKRPWQAVREAAAIVDEHGRPWFRIEDTRHTGATRLAEAGVPVDVITARMGHAGTQMRLHYTHISEQAQHRWLEHAGVHSARLQTVGPAGHRTGAMQHSADGPWVAASLGFPQRPVKIA